MRRKPLTPQRRFTRQSSLQPELPVSIFFEEVFANVRAISFEGLVVPISSSFISWIRFNYLCSEFGNSRHLASTFRCSLMICRLTAVLCRTLIADELSIFAQVAMADHTLDSGSMSPRSRGMLSVFQAVHQTNLKLQVQHQSGANRRRLLP